MKAYYNEIDPYAAQWLRNLIAASQIALGDVDERDIRDVTPTDLNGYDRCHFFAGIAGWDYALQLAGWPEDLPVWTGSCPCQPFSAAGRGGKGTDERHLWPAWFHLIRVCRPPIIFGEQVASKDGLKWLDLVCSDLEAEGYAVGAADLCAAGVGAPHIRQRLWFVAYSGCRNQGQCSNSSEMFNEWDSKERSTSEVGGPSPTGELADTGCNGFGQCEHPGELVQATSQKSEHESGVIPNGPIGGGTDGNFWSNALWLPCRDGKARPTRTVEPDILRMLPDGVSVDLGLVCSEGQTYIWPLVKKTFGRVGRLRAYGNAINPWVAKEFIRAFMEKTA